MPRTSYADHTPATLKAIAESLREKAERIVNVAEQIGDRGFDALSVGNHAEMEKAMLRLEKFVSAARESLEEGRLKRGDYLPPGGVYNALPKSPPKGRKSKQ